MKEVKLIYKGKKSVVLSFDFKGKFQAVPEQIYSSNDYKLLQDEEMVKMLVEKQNFELVEEPKPIKKKTKKKEKLIIDEVNDIIDEVEEEILSEEE